MSKKNEVVVTENLTILRFVPNKIGGGGTLFWAFTMPKDADAPKGKLTFTHDDNPGGGSFSAINDGEC